MSEPVLTVVVPCSNSERFLDRCLRSISGAERGKLEVIVVDNQSKDRTLEIVAAYGDLVTQIISEPDRGQSDALNKGFRAANGTFVCWLNSDDEFVAGAVPRIVADLQVGERDWYTAGMVWIDEESRIIRCSPPLPYWSGLAGYGATGVGGPSSFVRRSAIEQAGTFDEQLHFSMDTDMWYRLHARGVKLQLLNEYVWAFRIHVASKTSHLHLGEAMNAAMARERLLLAQRHGFGTSWFDERVLVSATRVLGFLSGRDQRAWLDSWRYRGKDVSSLQCRRHAHG